MALQIRTAIAAAILGGATTCPHAANQVAVNTSHKACAKLKEAAVTYRLSVHDLTGRYYCEVMGHDGIYFIMGLRYLLRPNEVVGSNLLGWYAIRRSDGIVLTWDINEAVAVPLEMGPPFKVDDEWPEVAPPNKSLERTRGG